ncbi:MAG: hypothetical protein ACT4QG_18600 [Sporichthyaceae bacterium]
MSLAARGVLVLAVVGLFAPPAAGAAEPATNSIKGEGNIGVADVVFEARNLQPTGTAATGTYTAKNSPALNVFGEVVCLKVKGKKAGFIFTADDASTPGFAGRSFLVTVESLKGPGSFGVVPLATSVGLTTCNPGAVPITATNGHFGVNDVDPQNDARQN